MLGCMFQRENSVDVVHLLEKMSSAVVRQVLKSTTTRVLEYVHGHIESV